MKEWQRKRRRSITLQRVELRVELEEWRGKWNPIYLMYCKETQGVENMQGLSRDVKNVEVCAREFMNESALGRVKTR